jgi:hypothetical protein
VWFAQKFGNEVRLIDYWEESGAYMPEWCRRLQASPYTFSRHIAPHDVVHPGFVEGQSRLDIARSHGVVFDVAPKLKIAEGIDIVRRKLASCWFDADKCYRGIEALKTFGMVTLLIVMLGGLGVLIAAIVIMGRHNL